MKYSNGETYDGEWKEGIFDGQGTYTWLNGSSYSGGYRRGEEDGKGTFTDGNGKVTKGIWSNEGFVRERIF